MIPFPEGSIITGVVTAVGFYRPDYNTVEELSDGWIRFTVRGLVNLVNLDHVIALVETESQ